jgi:hypothetical protein
MRSKYLAALAAATILTGSSVAASAQTASAVDRTPAPVSNANQLDDDGGYTIWIIGAVVLGLLIWGIIELTNDDDEPASP